MKPSERKKSLVRKWGMSSKRTSEDIAAVAAGGGEESSSAFEDFYRVRATPVQHTTVESTIRSNRCTAHCVAEGGADVDVYCFQTAVERYFYRCELGLQVARVALVVLTGVLMLSLSHYGFQITRSGLYVVEGWICEAPIDITNHVPPSWYGDRCGTISHVHDGDISNSSMSTRILPTASTIDEASTPTQHNPSKLPPTTSAATHTPSSFCVTSIIHQALFWIEYNPALLATTPFARPLVQFILVGLIVLVSRAKRLSKLEPTRKAVERMNVEVLQPVMGLRYDIDSNLLLVRATD